MKKSTRLSPLGLALLLLPSTLWADQLLSERQQRELRASVKVDSELVDALERHQKARVIVFLEVRDEDGHEVSSFSSAEARRALRAEGNRVLERMPEGHFDLAYQYAAFNSLAGEADAEGVLALMAQPEVAGVGLDERQSWSLAEALPLSGIRSLRSQTKHGKGVWVAVLDSGVDTDHRDLKKPLKKQECFCRPDCCPNGTARQSGRGSAEDDVGHGTLVAGTVVSRGKVGPGGVARNAKLLAIKVGGPEGPLTSDTLAALDYVHQEMPQVQALNMSFGTSRSWKGNCDRKGATNRARAAAIDSLRDQGILSFAASGNSARSNGMGAPACIKNAISVGAVYDENFGIVDWGDCADVSGPNELVCFTDRSKTTDLLAVGALITGPELGGGVTSNVGTSFASPLATGCAVLIRKSYPDATPDEIEEALKSSGVDVFDSASGRTYPALDCQAAFDQLGG